LRAVVRSQTEVGDAEQIGDATTAIVIPRRAPPMTTTVPPAPRPLPLELLRPANLLSLARIPLAGVAIALRHHPLALLGLMCAAGITDMLDGFVARKTGSDGRVGGWLDPVCDKIFIVAALVAVWVEHRPPAWLVLLALMRELLVVPLTLVHLGAPGRESRDVEFRARPMGKATTVLQFAVLLALVANRMALAAALAAVTGLVGAIAGVDYVVRSRR
jgi:phosphatidylglycerophosphate synthase